MSTAVLAERLRRTMYAFAGLIGYILSPASWWNDAVVNIPLALAMARAAHTLLGTPTGLAFAASYWATNILGIILMVAGASGAAGKRPGRREILVGLAASTLYTIAVILGLQALGVN